MSLPELTSIPTLDDIVAHPERAGSLSAEVTSALLVQIVSLQTLLLGQLLRERTATTTSAKEEDRLLTVEEAAQKLGATTDWLYRQAATLPFTVRMSRHVRFSERGVERWIKARLGRHAG